ncbi:hypothetical protein [Georgenia sp. AZ-5]|uniref:hypothetical protein n=1 Tax=Georgenia sp. AZ-5 TaxID=3367526 RepID=UPI003754C6F1
MEDPLTSVGGSSAVWATTGRCLGRHPSQRRPCFGNSPAALTNIFSGDFAPQGRMPFALAGTREAIERQNSDTPG